MLTDESDEYNIAEGMNDLNLSTNTIKRIDELTHNILTAMSCMTPEVIANIVNANMELPEEIQPSASDSTSRNCDKEEEKHVDASEESTSTSES